MRNTGWECLPGTGKAWVLSPASRKTDLTKRETGRSEGLGARMKGKRVTGNVGRPSNSGSVPAGVCESHGWRAMLNRTQGTHYTHTTPHRRHHTPHYRHHATPQTPHTTDTILNHTTDTTPQIPYYPHCTTLATHTTHHNTTPQTHTHKSSEAEGRH